MRQPIDIGVHVGQHGRDTAELCSFSGFVLPVQKPCAKADHCPEDDRRAYPDLAATPVGAMRLVVDAADPDLFFANLEELAKQR